MPTGETDEIDRVHDDYFALLHKLKMAAIWLYSNSVGGYVVISNRLGIFAIVLATTFFGIVTTSASKLELLPFF